MALTVIIGVIGTIASSLYTVTLVQPNGCHGGVTGAGFPFPWRFSLSPYTGPPTLLPCPLIIYSFSTFSIYGPITVAISFLSDTIFYETLLLGAVEAYRRVITKNLTSTLAPPVHQQSEYRQERERERERDPTQTTNQDQTITPLVILD